MTTGLFLSPVILCPLGLYTFINILMFLGFNNRNRAYLWETWEIRICFTKIKEQDVKKKVTSCMFFFFSVMFLFYIITEFNKFDRFFYHDIVEMQQTKNIRKESLQGGGGMFYLVQKKRKSSLFKFIIILTLLELKMLSFCHQYRARLTNFKVLILISLKMNMDCMKKCEVGYSN